MPSTARDLDETPEADVDAEHTAASSSYRWVILGFGILGYAATLFARQNYSGVQQFIAADLHLDKALLGLLGSVFFYSYALFQMPWDVASDRWGSRSITGIGVVLVAATMVGFATSQSAAQLLFWLAASGVARAAVYVAMTGGASRWFPQHERGLSQTALGGVGGALGVSAAFVLLPAMAIYVPTGWRQATGRRGDHEQPGNCDALAGSRRPVGRRGSRRDSCRADKPSPSVTCGERLFSPWYRALPDSTMMSLTVDDNRWSRSNNGGVNWLS